MELYRVIKRDEPIKELGYKIDGMKEYVARLEEELKETGAVHRNIYMMQHEINVLRQKEREKELKTGELQKIEVLEYLYQSLSHLITSRMKMKKHIQFIYEKHLKCQKENYRNGMQTRDNRKTITKWIRKRNGQHLLVISD